MAFNVADGYQALYTINKGSQNVGIGTSALLNAEGSTNIAIGYQAGVNLKAGNGNIYIASPGGTSDEFGTIHIGTPGVQTSAYIAGIVGAPALKSPTEVFIDMNTNQLSTRNSSARFKEDIKNMAAYSHRLFDLRPVTYRYKQPYADGAKPVEPGLIAEEVAQVYPDLVAYGTDGQIETVQYHKLAPMLLNELQNQERRLEAQAAQLDMQTGRNAALEAEIQNLKTSLADARADVRRSQDALAERLEKLELVSRTSATHAAH
ncbi:MAG: tail fiber domain-containing protein [Methylocella sp.]